MPISFILIPLYLLAIIGILTRQKWILIIVMIIVIIDIGKGIIMFPVDAFFLGAVVGDLLLIYLSYKDYKNNFS